MATTYTFILKDKTTNLGGNTIDPKTGEVLAPKGVANKVFTGSNKGVEHNRYMRAVNPIINRYTGGQWEKGLRLTRATRGVVDTYQNKGVAAMFGSVGFIIIVQMVLLALIKYWEKEKKKAAQENEANYLKIKTGQTLLNNNYKINRNFWTGKATYSNQ